MSSSTVSPSAAYGQVKKLPWEKASRRDWALKKAQKYVTKVGHAKGLAEQIASLGALGLSGRKLKRPYIRQLKAWKNAYTGNVQERAAEAVQNVAAATGEAVDKVLEIAGNPTVQAGINAALVAAGLPPINFDSASAQSLEEALAVWQASVDEPEVTDDDPELAEGSSGGASKGGLWAIGASALLFVPRLLGRR